jgi:tetrahydromethanopterin S-methyltransferase subunit C
MARSMTYVVLANALILLAVSQALEIDIDANKVVKQVHASPLRGTATLLAGTTADHATAAAAYVSFLQ